MSRAAERRSARRLDPARRPAIWSAGGILPLPGTTYLDHVDALLPRGARGPVPDHGAPYPDDERPGPDDVGWMAGAFEGVMALRGAETGGPEPTLAAAAIREACRLPLGTQSVHLVADRLTALDMPADVDRVLAELRVDSAVGRARLAELARWLCRFGTRLRQVQTGLALLAAVGGRQDRALVTRLGLLDTLTPRAVDALRRILEGPSRVDLDGALFALAKQTAGWGRIHAVLGLRGTTDQAIQRWLLRGGYDSGVLDEELAGVAAITGDLAGALQGEVDASLLHHAGRLLEALTHGGPAEDLSDYPEGAVAIELYLRAAKPAAPSAEILGVMQTLDSYLRGSAAANPHLDPPTRARLATLTATLLQRPGWVDAAEAELTAVPIGAFRRALRPASRIGVDVRPAIRDRLLADPGDPYLWAMFVERATGDDVTNSVALAVELLDPVGLAQRTPRSRFSRDPLTGSLELLLHWLRNRPDLGWPLIGPSLASPVTQVRREALRALTAWPDSDWPPEAAPMLARLRWSESDPELRGLFVSLSARAT